MPSRPARCWSFTSFVVVDPEEFKQRLAKHPNFGYCIWQLEKCPETGRMHMQGGIKFNKKQLTMTQVKEVLGLPQAHLEFAVSWEHLKQYCAKEETREQGPWECGVDKPQLTIDTMIQQIRDKPVLTREEELDLVCTDPVLWSRHIRLFDRVRALALPITRVFTDIEVHWGVTGSGKTHSILALALNAYWWNQGPYFSNYHGETVLVIDEFDDRKVPLKFLLSLGSNAPLYLPVKMREEFPAQFTKIYLLTNTDPTLWYGGEDTASRAALTRRFGLVKYYAVPFATRAQSSS